MAKKLFLLLVLAAIAGGAYFALRDRASAPTATSTTATTTVPTAPAGQVPIKAYFFQDNSLVPVTVDVPKTAAVATAAITALLAGPPTGYTTTLPRGAKLVAVHIASGTATAEFSGALVDVDRTAQAQIVSTLNQFATVQRVEIATGSGPALLVDRTGALLGRAATASDYADLNADAPIFVRTPARNSAVPQNATFTGTAIAFEATIAVEIHQGAQPDRTEAITASTGAPNRGTWTYSVQLAPGLAHLVFYEPSAKDGSHLHSTEITVNVHD